LIAITTRYGLWIAAFVAVGALFGGRPQAWGDSIVNGSFESGNYTFDGNGADSLPVGSTAITGWTTFGGELAPIENTNNFGPITTPFGSIFLDLTGYHDSSPHGGVMQTISTVNGQSYVLTLDLGVYPSNAAYNGPISVHVQAGTASTTFTDTTSTGTGSIWTPFSFGFTANSTSTLISIQGTQGINYIGLDNVSVNPATATVPEPSSLVMGTTVAIVGLGCWRYRRRAKAAKISKSWSSRNGCVAVG
jgi:hypothetical protein